MYIHIDIYYYWIYRNFPCWFHHFMVNYYPNLHVGRPMFLSSGEKMTNHLVLRIRPILCKLYVSITTQFMYVWAGMKAGGKLPEQLHSY